MVPGSAIDKVDALWYHLVYELKKFFDKSNKSSAVIGLSGGIDSAVVTALCCDALVPDRTVVAMMPSKYSSEGSITDSMEFIENLRIPSINVFQFGVDGVVNQVITEMFGVAKPRGEWTEGNLQARTRMMFLMAITNEREDRLVVNTCNLTEDLLGYATIYGDSTGAIAPLGNVGKMMVYALAERLNDRSEKVCIPKAILEKAPSAELAEGQTDEGQLEAEYCVLDPVTQALNWEEDLRPEEKRGLILKHGVDFVLKYEKMIENNLFKMEQAPPAIPLPTGLFHVRYSNGESVTNTVKCLGIDQCKACEYKECISHPKNGQ